MEDTQFLNDITTRKTKPLRKRFGFHLPAPQGTRYAPAIIAGLFLISVALLVALIVVATHSKKCSPAMETEAGDISTTPWPSSPIATDAGPTESHIWDNIRLPGDIVPSEYLIHLHPNLTTESVQGTVLIDVEVLNLTSVVIVHARDMNITASAVCTADVDVEIEETFLVESTQFFVMRLKQPLYPQNRTKLRFQWQSRLSNGLAGFYKSTYTSKDGMSHVIATTQFEATDARAAFPCFDEPAMKAHFNINIVYDPQLHKVQSNMPTWWNETQPNGLIRAHFMKSPKMSTYLVAFIISDFDFVQTMTKSNITVRVWARPDSIKQTDWALYCGALIIEYYEDFFRIPYPLPKQDLVAIPDFAAGAMENWGLITYRETDLLFDPHTSSSANRQRVTVVIAHELAHQWFGNLVTMKWWNNLWLNEGFASFVEYIGTERVANCIGGKNDCRQYRGEARVPPEWDMRDQFFVDTIEYAYSIDSLASSHPIDVVVKTPDQIAGVFDAISYDKGASILQMMYEFVGQPDFLTGLHLYLTEHEYGNAETGDLLRALDKVTHIDQSLTVATVMSTWTEQIGYPVINVNLDKTGHVTFHQQHFLLNKTSSTPSSPYNYIWSVPVSFYTDQGDAGTIWLTEEKQVTTLHGTDVKWIKVNVNQTGYYRVNYTTKMWHSLSEQLQQNHLVFSVRDRAGLIADAFALSRASQLNLTVALEIFKYLKSENHYVPWTAALDGLLYIGDMLSFSPVFGQFKAFMCHLLEPIVRDIGWGNDEKDTHIKRLLQGQLLHVGWQYDCLYQKSETMLQKASEKFTLFMQGNTSICPDLHSAVYGAGIANGGLEEWEFLWNVSQTTEVANEKRACLRALAETKQPWLLQRYLQYSVDETKVKIQDTVSVIAYVSRNPLGRRLAWDFVRSQWDTLFTKYGTSSFGFGRLVRYITAYFNTRFEVEEFQSFFAIHSAGSGAMDVSHAAEKIQNNMQWLRDNEELMNGWLTTFFASSGQRQTS